MTFDRDDSNRHSWGSSTNVGRRSATENYGQGQANAQSRVPGKSSATEHLPNMMSWTSGVPVAARLGDALDVGRRQLAALEAALRDNKRSRAAEQAWVLQGTLLSLQQLLVELATEEEVPSRRSECDALIAQGRARIAEIQDTGSFATEQRANSAAIAERGVQGDGQPLPFGEQIQAAFGRHDIRAVRAHVGGAAAEANHQLGAHAYATNNRIAFATQPNLFLAAHEATHVVQQRAGVALKGAIDQPGDAYEQHADEVASKVVRGESAERLLDGMAGQTGGMSPTVPVTQRKAASSIADVGPSAEAEDTRAAGTNKKKLLEKNGTAAQYFELHQRAFFEMVRAQLAASSIDTGNSQLHWQNGPAGFAEQLFFQLFGPDISEWPRLLYPNDPWRVIDEHRAMSGTSGPDGSAPATGMMTWSPPVGLAFATEIEIAVARSLRRVGARYVTAAGSGTRVTADELVAAHPMDRVVAEAICAANVVVVDHAKPNAKTQTREHDVQADGVRLVTDIEWLGARDANLWNCILVKEPSNATLEEIALTLWGKTELAYGLTPIWPYVVIPEEWAHQLPAARAYEPKVPRPGTSSTSERLAGSVLADEVALAQGVRAREDARQQKQPIASDRADVVEALDSTTAILLELRGQLDPVNLGLPIDPALSFVGTKRTWVAGATPEDLKRWAPVFVEQNVVVREIAAGVGKVFQLLAAAGLAADQVRSGGVNHPGRRVLESYSRAAGASMFVETAKTSLSRCQAEQAILPVRLLQIATGDADRAIGQLRQEEKVDPKMAQGRSAELASEHGQLAIATADLARQGANGSIDPKQLEAAELSAKSLTMRARIANLQHALAQLRGGLAAADEGVLATVANAFSLEMKVLPGEMDSAIADLQQVEGDLAISSPAQVNAKYDAMPASDGREFAREFELLETRRERVAAAQEALARVVQKRRLDGALFNRAAEAIHDAKIRMLLANVGAMVALAVASAGIANVAGEFAGGFVMGARGATTVADAAKVARTARIVSGVTGFVTDNALNAAGQSGLMGGSFIENFAGNAAISAALKPLGAVVQKWGGLDEEAFKLWERQGKRWKVTLAKGSVITADMILAAGASYAWHRGMAAVKGSKVDDMTAAEWAAQGATMMLGRYVHGKLSESLQRLSLAGRAAGDLVGRFTRQVAVAAKVEHAPDRHAGMEVFIQQHDLIQEEIAFWQRLEEDPAALAKTGMTRHQVDVHLHGAEAQAGAIQEQAFVQVQLRLAGLEQEVEGGRLWVGDSETVAQALGQAARVFKLEIEDHPGAARQWRVKLNGEELLIRERAREGRSREAKPSSEITKADVVEAKRYTSAVRTLRPALEAHYKKIIDSTQDFATDVAHLGNAFGGVMHRDTRFEGEHGSPADPHAELVIYAHDGAMTNRGDLRSGQNPDLQTMPAVRTREHTTEHESYTKSRDLGDATEVGRFEMQTPMYRAEVLEVQHIQNYVEGDSAKRWAHPDRRIRLRVKPADGPERWIYCSKVENAGGMGPTDFRAIRGTLGGPTASEQTKADMFAKMRERGVLLGADDPNISERLHPGQRVFVWGGSPSGAWAGEDAALHGAKPDVVGESPSVHRDSKTKPDVMTASEFEQALYDARDNPERVAQLVEQRISQTHTGSKLPRNQQPGATYGPDAKQRGINVEIGVPTSIRLLDSGKIEVTLGVGEAHAGVHKPGEAPKAVVREYDLVISALGQDPSAPGGPVGMIGKGVTKRDAQGNLDMNEPVPAGTIALRMILDSSKEQRLVGLESLDGTYQLVSAAYASDKLAPWVIPEQRALFIEKVKTIGAKGQRTHTGDAITADSAGVTTGIEAQRDRAPVANEVTSARDFRLPKQVSAERLSLPKGHPEQWTERLEEFLTASMRAGAGRLRVSLEPSGRDGVHLFRVMNGDEYVGILRVYDSMSQADAERQLGAEVRAAVPSLETGVERGTIAVDGGTTAQLASHAPERNQRAATFEGMIEEWSRSEGAAKKEAFRVIKAAVVRTAAHWASSMTSLRRAAS